MSRHFNDLDAVLESDSLNDFRQLVFSLQSPPGFCRSGDELEHHELGGYRRQGSLRSHLSLGLFIAAGSALSIIIRRYEIVLLRQAERALPDR